MSESRTSRVSWSYWTDRQDKLTNWQTLEHYLLAARCPQALMVFFLNLWASTAMPLPLLLGAATSLAAAVPPPLPPLPPPRFLAFLFPTLTSGSLLMLPAAPPELAEVEDAGAVANPSMLVANRESSLSQTCVICSFSSWVCLAVGFDACKLVSMSTLWSV